MKKQLFALPLFAAGLLIFSCATSKGNETPVETETATEQIVRETYNFTYSMETRKDTLKYLDYEVQYPVFDNNKVLNKAIKENSLIPLTNMIESAEPEWEELFIARGTDQMFPFEYFESVEEVIESEKYISIVSDHYTYTGGAHGYPMKKTINYSKEENKILSISEAAGMSLEKISRLCYECLLSSMEEYDLNDIDWVQNGTDPIEENFEAFAITDEGKTLTVYFNPYQVAPYAWGILAVKIEL